MCQQTGSCCCKLDQHDFTGIFLGYTATDQNIVSLDLNSGIVKSCHHAIFDEAWYLQPTQPPAAQLLYNLGLEAESTFVSIDGPLHLTQPGTIEPITISWPPNLPASAKPLTSLKTPRPCLFAPLPLCIMMDPHIVGARAARAKLTLPPKKNIAAKVVSKFMIGSKDMEMLYISPNPYYGAFEEELNLRKFDLTTHNIAGLSFLQKDNRLILISMANGTPGACVNNW
jgi:hypothetical protein